MEILKEIKDKEFPSDESTLKTREASRAVLFDENLPPQPPLYPPILITHPKNVIIKQNNKHKNKWISWEQ
jgi:hypothetical protein